MSRQRIGLFGAEGSLALSLARELAPHAQVRVISALLPSPDVLPEGVEVIQVDLFDPRDTAAVLEGLDCVLFLANTRAQHSLLVQARPEDLQLLLADQVSRICEARDTLLVFISALGDPTRSAFVQGQRNVERVIAGHDGPSLIARTGFVMAPAAMALKRLSRLHGELWLQEEGGDLVVITLHDLVGRLLELISERRTGRVDLAGPRELAPLEILQMIQPDIGPVLAPRPRRKVLARWARQMGVSRREAAFLHDVLAFPSLTGPSPTLWRGAEVIDAEETARCRDAEHPRAGHLVRDRRQLKRARRVRSVQRLSIPQGWKALDVERAYFEWLQQYMKGTIRIDRSDEGYRILAPGGLCLLALKRRPGHSDDETVLDVVGGSLVRDEPDGDRGWLEFRRLPVHTWGLVALNDFAPALPFGFYRRSQAVVHGHVMNVFRDWLASPYRV